MILDIFWSRVSIYLLVVWVISKCRKFWNFLLSPQHVSWIGSSRQILRIIWTFRVSPSLCVLMGTWQLCCFWREQTPWITKLVSFCPGLNRFLCLSCSWSLCLSLSPSFGCSFSLSLFLSCSLSVCLNVCLVLELSLFLSLLLFVSLQVCISLFLSAFLCVSFIHWISVSPVPFFLSVSLFLCCSVSSGSLGLFLLESRPILPSCPTVCCYSVCWHCSMCCSYEDLNLVPIVTGGFRTFCYW